MYKLINAREKVMKGIFLFSAIFSILAQTKQKGNSFFALNEQDSVLFA